MRWPIVASALVATLFVAAPPCRAADDGAPRPYLHIKVRDTNDLTGVHDLYGIGVGVDLDRHFGFELSGDRFELFPKISGIGTIGEYGVFTILPQARVRYPLLGGRLVPYALAGAGIALTNFNDQKPVAFGHRVRSESSTPIGTLGAGVEYFLTDNIALGVEFKYLFAGDQSLRVDGVHHDFNISSPLTLFALRLFYPDHTSLAVADAHRDAVARLFLGGRIGMALPAAEDLGDGIELRPVNAAIGGVLDEYFGLVVGAEFGRHLGAEVAVEGYEAKLATSDLGTVGEYAIYHFTPQVRLRYPMANGRVVPYGVAGVGLALAEFNDRKAPGAGVHIRAKSMSVSASLGAGIDYFMTRDIALGLEAKYVYSPGHSITIGARRTDATLQAALFSLGVRAFLFDF